MEYQYRRDYLLKQVDYFDAENVLVESATYTYDRNGNRLTAANANSTISSTVDPLGQLKREERQVGGWKDVLRGQNLTVAEQVYANNYTYDRVGNLRSITYPGSVQPVEYTYNRLNRLVGVTEFAPGTVQNPAVSYRDNGFVTGIRYGSSSHSLTTAMTPDVNGRVATITVTAQEKANPAQVSKLLDLSYAYDGNNNVSSRTNQLTGYTNRYSYDDLDRLTSATVEGTFFGERTGTRGLAEQDLLGLLVPVAPEDYSVKFDYQANSVGVVLAEPAAIGKIELIPDITIKTHRVSENTLSVYYSQNNVTFTKVAKELWHFIKDEGGDITITFEQPITGMAFKVHSLHDDWGKNFDYVDRSSFRGDLNKMVRVYQYSPAGVLEYDYDEGGNRLEKRKIFHIQIC